MIYDVIILGSGPAGLSAAIYAQRARLNTLVIEEKPLSGGQILDTYEVDNYPGLQGIGGFELGMKFREHADTLGVTFHTAQVQKVQAAGNLKEVVTEKETFQTKSVIVATGATHRKLGVQGEEELVGAGVSYCATCDGAFFKGKTVAVVGGGDVALEDALFLARGCEKIYLIHRRDEFRGAKVLQEQVQKTENITVLWNSEVKEIQGENKVEKILLHNNIEETDTTLEVQGIFIAVGIQPNNDAVKEVVAVDEQGYVKALEDTVTSEPGIFAAGDVRTKQLRQVITAAADGANAVTSVERYLLTM
ncbi:thioredoxin-disulfide reductase [Roseburia sp. MSJ-14]|uniref:thioredoxin-disulfide reductase n=1 Tax=Roseburia sp. MSJ-14 TaxID=2841514 RepID=UPI001C117939|nr:thioredoxin-disulfide reductase [Roseburia sp. MSJ-14]MBU5474973.1 thioredoxin-disulfide reductase [Roseburia sp. MSJ-14]